MPNVNTERYRKNFEISKAIFIELSMNYNWVIKNYCKFENGFWEYINPFVGFYMKKLKQLLIYGFSKFLVEALEEFWKY